MLKAGKKYRSLHTAEPSAGTAPLSACRSSSSASSATASTFPCGCEGFWKNKTTLPEKLSGLRGKAQPMATSTLHLPIAWGADWMPLMTGEGYCKAPTETSRVLS